MRQILAIAVGLAVLAATACSAPAPPRSAVPAPAPAGPVTLPVPTGAHPVGTTTLYPTDTSRPDPWNLDVGVRELVVTLWYPTTQRDGPRAPYMTEEESELLLKGSRLAEVPPAALSTTVTNAVQDAPPAGERLPLVVLSPGFTKPVSTLTSLAEELASRGYVVAGIDHTYENHATTFPDGRVAECLACDVDTDPGFGTGVVRSRAAGPCSTWQGCALIDRSRIAMVGQSIGGASAVAAMVEDPRIGAGVDMDGTTYARIPRDGFTRPFLFLGTEQHVPGGRDTTWDRDWALLTGWKRWLLLAGADHASFTDLPLLSEVLGIPTPTGALPATRYSELTRAYVGAFLDEHLHGRPQTVLDEAPEPEVVICSGDVDACR
jgi:dienelactone hydrolase